MHEKAENASRSFQIQSRQNTTQFNCPATTAIFKRTHAQIIAPH